MRRKHCLLSLLIVVLVITPIHCTEIVCKDSECHEEPIVQDNQVAEPVTSEDVVDAPLENEINQPNNWTILYNTLNSIQFSKENGITYYNKKVASKKDKNPLGLLSTPQPCQESAKVIDINKELMEQIFDIKINTDDVNTVPDELTSLLTGKTLPESATGFTQKFGNNKYGRWDPETAGDFRATSLGTFVVPSGSFESYSNGTNFWELQLQSTGKTPFTPENYEHPLSVEDAVREYLGSAMLYGLNVPTSLSLALSACEQSDDGEVKKVALLQAAPTWLRLSTFEKLYRDGNAAAVKKLVDVVIDSYFPALKALAPDHTGINHPKYLEFLREVVRRNALLVAHWRALNFCHGLLDTENINVLGVTMNFKRYGVLEIPSGEGEFACNKIDDPNERYKLASQDQVVMWNLKQFSDSLGELIDIRNQISILGEYYDALNEHFGDLMAQKFGFDYSVTGMDVVVTSIYEIMECERLDQYTFFRTLGRHVTNGETVPRPIASLFTNPECASLFKYWWMFFTKIRSNENRSVQQQRDVLLSTNPLYVLRQSVLQDTIEQVKRGSFSDISQIRAALMNPYEKNKSLDKSLESKLRAVTPKQKSE